MTDTHPLFHTTSMAVISSLLLFGVAGCDPSFDEEAADFEPGAPEPLVARPVGAERGPTIDLATVASEYGELLAAAGPAEAFGKCKLDTWRFRLPEDGVAITTPPNGFFTPFPPGIPTFDEPGLEDSYIFVVKMRNLANEVVGYASEQELANLETAEGKTSYTLTLPDRGTLFLYQRESFQILLDAVDDMIADGELVRTFDPPLVEVLTIPGTGRVVGGSEEFLGAIGVMQEIGIVYKIDLLNNEFDLAVIVQAFHC